MWAHLRSHNWLLEDTSVYIFAILCLHNNSLQVKIFVLPPQIADLSQEVMSILTIFMDAYIISLVSSINVFQTKYKIWHSELKFHFNS